MKIFICHFLKWWVLGAILQVISAIKRITSNKGLNELANYSRIRINGPISSYIVSNQY